MKPSRVVILSYLISLCFTCWASERGQSGPNKNNGGIDISMPESEASLLVTDNLGDRTGITDEGPVADNGRPYREIPRSGYSSYGIASDDPKGMDTSPSQFIEIYAPEKGTYRIHLVGRKNGPFDLQLDTFSSDGSRKPSLRISGAIERSKSIEIEVKYDPAPGVAPVVHSESSISIKS